MAIAGAEARRDAASRCAAEQPLEVGGAHDGDRDLGDPRRLHLEHRGRGHLVFVHGPAPELRQGPVLDNEGGGLDPGAAPAQVGLAVLPADGAHPGGHPGRLEVPDKGVEGVEVDAGRHRAAGRLQVQRERVA